MVLITVTLIAGALIGGGLLTAGGVFVLKKASNEVTNVANRVETSVGETVQNVNESVKGANDFFKAGSFAVYCLALVFLLYGVYITTFVSVPKDSDFRKNMLLFLFWSCSLIAVLLIVHIFRLLVGIMCGTHEEKVGCSKQHNLDPTRKSHPKKQ